MTQTATLTLRLPRAVLERLERLASSTKRSKSALAEEALAAYLAAQEWQTAAITEAVEAADAGAMPIEHAAVQTWLQSRGTGNERPRPR